MYAFSCAAVLHPPPLRNLRRRGRTLLCSVTVSLSTTSESPIPCSSSSSSHHHNPSLCPFAPEVVFANGTFIDGSTSELSCDGPLREPFCVYCQGGTHCTQWALILDDVIKSIEAVK